MEPMGARAYLWATFDVFFVGFFVYSAWSSWQTPISLTPAQQAILHKVEERSLGVSAVSGAVGAGITGASIILGVIGAIVGLGAQNLPSRSKHHFVIAAGLCGLSLLAGAVNMAAIPQLAWKENVAFSRFPASLLALQIYAMVPASIRLFLGILKVVI
jgi:hypothetical protein